MIEYHDATTTEGARAALVNDLLDGFTKASLRVDYGLTFERLLNFSERALAVVLSSDAESQGGRWAIVLAALGGDPLVIAHRECLAEAVRVITARGYSPSKLERIKVAKDEE